MTLKSETKPSSSCGVRLRFEAAERSDWGVLSGFTEGKETLEIAVISNGKVRQFLEKER